MANLSESDRKAWGAKMALVRLEKRQRIGQGDQSVHLSKSTYQNASGKSLTPQMAILSRCKGCRAETRGAYLRCDSETCPFHKFAVAGGKKVLGSRLKTIKVYCLECSGGQREVVRRCNIDTCPLHPYRPGANKFTELPVIFLRSKVNADLPKRSREFPAKKYPPVLCECCGTRHHCTYHHILPRSEGGGDHRTNLMWLCSECHDKAEVEELRSKSAIMAMYERNDEGYPIFAQAGGGDWHTWVYGGARNGDIERWARR